MPYISYFTSLSDRKPKRIELKDFYYCIKNAVRQQSIKSIIEQIRATTDKDKISELKKQLPAVTLSGVFEGGHKAANLKERSGLMQIDFDGVDVDATKKPSNASSTKAS